jgi:phytoene dehydrogenase-like protein
MNKYDAIVIGAGNGGLTASTALAQKGLNVLLLERHNIPGGCATSFCRGRFEFEIALHQLSGLGTPEMPGPLRLDLEGLGVMQDLEFVEISDLYSVHNTEGFHVALKPDKEQILDELKITFPHEKDAIDAFFDLVYKYASDMIGAFIFRDPEASIEKYPHLYKYAFKPAQSVIDDHFTDPLLKAVLSVYWGYLGVSMDQMAFAYLAMILYQYIEFKPFHVKGGSQALSNAILNKFLSHGGTARFNCGARQIQIGGDAVKAVVTDQGDVVASDYIVSNVSPIVTYGQLIGEELIPENTITEVKSRQLSTSAFTMFVGFDCEPHDIEIQESTNFLMKDTDMSIRNHDRMRRIDIDDELMVLSCYDVSDPEFSPEGTCQANIVTLKYGEPWLRLPPQQYQNVKYRCAEQMLQRVQEIYPDARAHIEEIEVGTPLTHMRYLGHPLGAIYGFEQQTKDSLFFQPGRYSPIKGLYFAGCWTGDGGFQPTLSSGISTARSIAKQIDNK